MSNELYLKQLDLKNSKKEFKTAVAIIKAKMKNQINLVKYNNRYRETSDNEEFVALELSHVIKGVKSNFKGFVVKY